MKMNYSDRGSCRGGGMSGCRRRAVCRLAVLLVCTALAQTGFSRAYKFRLLRTTSEATKSSAYSDDVARRESYQVELSASSRSDSLDDMEIRAATLLKQANGKESVINDVATFTNCCRRRTRSPGGRPGRLRAGSSKAASSSRSGRTGRASSTGAAPRAPCPRRS